MHNKFVNRKIFCYAPFCGGFATLPQNSTTQKMPVTKALGEKDSEMILKQVTITKESMEDEDPYGVILSNIDIINDLLSNHVRHDEICIQSLKSYYVDYYLAQVNNGGFSQFVYNSN